ncbi:MAG: hypothetical protein IPO72_18620 [Saprospiraceae bacterium]|nr:hypothetical protein [Candidatus Vicinibacter affinis]
MDIHLCKIVWNYPKESASKLESLIDAFEMANMLNATGKFERNQKYYYKYILMHYQSREIYNNVSCRKLEAISAILIKKI